MYAFQYGRNIVPAAPASAAMIPSAFQIWVRPRDLRGSIGSTTQLRSRWQCFHPRTFVTRLLPAPAQLLKEEITPQWAYQTRSIFRSGKAISKPTSRMAKMLDVLATDHNAPASRARRLDVVSHEGLEIRIPFPQDSRQRPARHEDAQTMPGECTKGETPIVTNLVGASAAPTRIRPSSTHYSDTCRDREFDFAPQEVSTWLPIFYLQLFLGPDPLSLVNKNQNAHHQDHDGYPELEHQITSLQVCHY